MLGTRENQCPDGITSISVLIRNLSHEVSFIRAQIASVEEELGTITQTLKSHLPGPAAALNDRQARANRLIIWRHFTQKDKPTQKASSILRSLPLSFQLSSLKASWLTSKKNRGIMGILAALPTPDDVSADLAHSDVVKQRLPIVCGLTPDRPIEE